MEFLVEFDVRIPEEAPAPEVERRLNAESTAAARLAREGHLVRLWKPQTAQGKNKAVGVYRARNERELDRLLRALPLNEWMQTTVTPLEPHANDPATMKEGQFQLPDPRVTPVYRLEATLGQPLDLGDTARGHRRIVPLTGGTFAGPEIRGQLVPGASADWQTVLPDGTAEGDIRYTLRTDDGALLYVQSRGVRHGNAEVLARLARGEDVDPADYTFRASTQIETAAPELDWLNKGVFASVAARQAAGVIYETYLVA
jgi:muconolactone delta-isomerase